jgi:hypothetical protein
MQLQEPRSDQRIDSARTRHPDAVARSIDVNPGVDVNRHPSATSIRHADLPLNNLSTGPTLERDREIVSLLVLLRMLATAELRTAFFDGKHPSLVTRALKRLTRDGWITTWDEPVATGGGSPRWAIPTARAIRWASTTLRNSVRDEPWARLVDMMLPRDRIHPLTLARGKAPAFLSHQREVNKLCIRFRAAFGEQLLWVSALDKPFPAAIGGIAMPQPDFALVLDHGGTQEIVFGEHDRGSESLGHFRAAKMERYARLGDLPMFTSDRFGTQRFSVLISVIDAVGQKPRARLENLRQCAADHGGRVRYTFHLGGALHSTPRLERHDASLAVTTAERASSPPRLV